MKKIRLIFTENCNRGCAGCCNKDYDFTKYPTFMLSVEHTQELIISGGEPMLYPDEVYAFIGRARTVGYKNKIYMYTADCREHDGFEDLFDIGLNGVTLTLHEQEDFGMFESFNDFLMSKRIFDKDLRLNVFKGVKMDDTPYPLWDIKTDIEWIKNCPLPKDETLMVLR